MPAGDRLGRLSDEDMVNFQRLNLLDSTAPNPSVETLFHAFLPHKFIDHTHANAILALSDQLDGEALCREVFDGKMVLVPYVMPGFALARLAGELQAKSPKAEGMILLKHGIFTWGDDAKQAYDRMIEYVTRAEERLYLTQTRQRDVRGRALYTIPSDFLSEIDVLVRDLAPDDLGWATSAEP